MALSQFDQKVQLFHCF